MPRTTEPLLSDRVFKLVRRLVEYVLPASGALYASLAALWGLPYPEQIVGTIAAVTVFLAAVVGLSRAAYNNSEVGVAKARIAEVVESLPPDANEINIQVQRPNQQLE